MHHNHIISGVEELTRENQVALENLAHEKPAADDIVAHQLHPETDVYKVPLEEFLYFANIQRLAEKEPGYGQESAAESNLAAIPLAGFVTSMVRKRKNTDAVAPVAVSDDVSSDDAAGASKEADGGVFREPNQADVTAGLINANRALRTASWVNVFYLITTDILGPSSAPYAISQLGMVPGTLLFMLLGIAAAYTGYLIWKMFLRLDSAHYPMRSYGDLVGRIYGKKVRYGVDLLQAIQLLCNVAVIILGNGQGLYQVASAKVCFSVLTVVWAFAGMIVGQIRSLQKFGFLANSAIWMNLFICFATMGLIAKFGPDFSVGIAQNKVPMGPVQVIGIVGGSNFNNQLQATMNIVYSYGGAMVFVNFLAEMRQPWDFWKGMALAQAVIFICYLLYGLVVYNYAGQFTANPANQGVSPFGWQTALNVINLVSALIAAGLYGNVGIKVVYITFIRPLIRGPDIDRPGMKGRLAWLLMVVVYWALAFIIASAIPQFSTLTSLVGAVCILQFTYTFPPIMVFGLNFQLDAMEADGEYDPITKTTNRFDTWSQKSRWTRAFMKAPLRNLFHITFFFAALATAALGIYASAMNLKSAFSSGSTTAFVCNNTNI